MSRIVKIDDVCPIYKIENGVLISKNGDLTVGYEIYLPELWTLGDSDYEKMHSDWVNCIKDLPAYTIVHKQDIYYDAEYKYEGKQETFLQRGYARHFNGRHHLKHKCYLFFTKSTKDAIKNSTARWSPLCKTLIPQENCDPNEQTAFFKAVDLAMAGFKMLSDEEKNICVTYRKLSTTDLVGTKQPCKFGLLDLYTNLSFGQEDLITLNDIHTEDGDLIIGNKLVSIHTLAESEQLPLHTATHSYNVNYSTPPYYVCNSFVSPLGERLGFEHIYNQYFFLEDNIDVIKDLTRKSNLLGSTASLSKVNEVTKKRTDDFIDHEAETKERICRCAFNIITWDRNAKNLEKKNTKLEREFISLDCKQVRVSDIAPQIFWGGIAGAESYYPMDDTFITFVNNGCDFVITDSNYKDWVDNSNFHINLCDRIFGIPIKVDLDDMPMRNGWISNRNKIIVGPSGSGKSFFINNMLMQYYEMNTHIVIVDVGDSYQGLSNLIKEETNGKDGTYFTYKEDDPIQFNPFFVSDNVYSEEKIGTLVSLISLLWKGDEKTSQTEYTFLKMSINNYIDYILLGTVKPNLNSYYEYLDKEFREYLSIQKDKVTDSEFNIGNLLHNLQPYYKGGKYDFLLNSEKELNLLEDRFIVFELDNIKENKTLFPIVSLIIMDTFVEKMRKLNNNNIRKFMLIEEAWQALSKENMAEFVKYLFKTVRKFFGEIAVVTQEVKDLVGNKIVQDVCVSQADTKILLDFSGYKENMQPIQEALGLSKEEIAILLSVNKKLDFNNRNRYKEVFVSVKKKSQVFATEVSNEEYMAYTTERPEKATLFNIKREKNCSMAQAIELYVKHKRKI